MSANDVSLIKELNYGQAVNGTGSKQQDDKLLMLIDDIIKDFTEKKSYLINDAEAGNLPQKTIRAAVVNYLDRKNINIGESRDILIKKVNDYLFGYYVLQDLIDDTDISDIRALKWDNIWIKKKGVRKPSDIKFPSPQSYDVFWNYVVIKLGGTLDKRNALQVLTDKSQKDFILRISLSAKFVNSVSNSYMSIRKTPKDKNSLEILKDKYKMLDDGIYDYSIMAAKAGLNILVCGKGGSGKTTYLNAILDKIPEDVAGLIIQESEELHSIHPNIMFQKVKNKVGESDVEYSLSKFSRFAMTEDIDLFGIGEVKGPEALDLFKIMNTGHIGWASVHSNNSSEAPDKLVDYMQEANTNLRRTVLLRMLKAIDVIIFMKDYKIFEVTEVVGFDEKREELEFNPVFKYDYKTGSFERLNASCDKVKDKIEYAKFKRQQGSDET